VAGEEGDSVEGEGLKAAGAARQVKEPDEQATQAEVHRPAVHDDPIVALDTAAMLKVKKNAFVVDITLAQRHSGIVIE